jgi:hypothetical protein
MNQVSIPTAWLENAGNDLLVVNALKGAGIPATGIERGQIQLSQSGKLTSAASGPKTTISWVPAPLPPDPRDAQIAAQGSQIADLQNKLAASRANESGLQTKLTAAESASTTAHATNSDLQSKLSEAQTLITQLQGRATTAENLNSSLQAQVNASVAQIAELKQTIAKAESSLNPPPASEPAK